MSAEFDPYYTWLGIPPQEQPPHHYRLLGIRALEDNRDVITHAMDQRMAHLRTLQSGKHAEQSQKLLNEVSTAAVVLLDAAKKAQYDEALGQRLAPAADAPPAPPLPPPAPAFVPPPPVAGRHSSMAAWLLVAGAIAGTAAALLLFLVAVAVYRSWNAADLMARGGDGGARASAGGESSAPPPAVEPAKEDVPRIATYPAQAAPADSSRRPMPPSPALAADTKNSDPPSAAIPIEPPAGAAPATAAPPSPAPTTTSESTTPQPKEPSSALPAPAEIEAARTKVLAIYGEEARHAMTPEQKRALAEKLMQVAGETTNDPAVKFVLLDAARKLLVAAGEIDQTLTVVATLADEFDEDLRELQLASLAAMADLSLPADRRDQLAAALLKLINQSVAEEEFAAADEFAKLAVRISARSSDVNLRRAIVQRRSELTRLGDDFRAVRQAREKLAADPTDPAANLVVGRFLCFALADFEQGVPHLVRSGKEPFAAAAGADQAAVQGPPDAALAAGDAWYALAESIRNSDKELLPAALVRTRHWYERALPQLSGLDKARVEKRMQEIGLVSSPSPHSGDKSPAKTKGKKGKRKAQARDPGAPAPPAK